LEGERLLTAVDGESNRGTPAGEKRRAWQHLPAERNQMTEHRKRPRAYFRALLSGTKKSLTEAFLSQNERVKSGIFEC